jgi:coatomer protein complex subunit alpha (xenin)
MNVELERRKLTSGQQDISSLPENTRKRALELSAYFTIPEMDTSHVTLALLSAMNFAQKNKQLSSALTFANNIIEKGTNTKYKESVSSLKILSSWLPLLTLSSR